MSPLLDTPTIKKKTTAKKKTVAKKTTSTDTTIYGANNPSISGMYTSGGGLYFDATKGPIANPDDYVAKYSFNPPLLSAADRGNLPQDLYAGPAVKERGYLFQDPDVTLSDSVGGGDPESSVEYVRLNQSSSKYGFRFLYNPAQVSMAVGYSAGVDIKAIQNNLDSMYNPIVPQTGSNIVFELLLNRVEDLALGDRLSTDMYPKGMITAEQIRDIKAHGTMSDYEYLLLTLNSGKKLKSKYRGNTADIGWLLGGAVVLKLGKSLTYKGFIENVSINHTRFTPNMIPSMSSVQITMARMVDLVPESEGSGRSGGGGTF